MRHCARDYRQSNVIIANDIIVTATSMGNRAFRAAGEPLEQGKVINGEVLLLVVLLLSARDHQQCDYRDCYGGYCILPLVHHVSPCAK